MSHMVGGFAAGPHLNPYAKPIGIMSLSAALLRPVARDCMQPSYGQLCVTACGSLMRCRLFVTVRSIDFPPEFQRWDTTDPASLFSAPVIKSEANPKVLYCTLHVLLYWFVPRPKVLSLLLFFPLLATASFCRPQKGRSSALRPSWPLSKSSSCCCCCCYSSPCAGPCVPAPAEGSQRVRRLGAVAGL